MATSNPLALFASDKVITEFPGRKIYVGGAKGKDLFNLLVYELNEEQLPIRVVYARRGELDTDIKEKQVLMKLYDARLEQRDDENPNDLAKIQLAQMGQTVFPIPLKELYEKNKKRQGPSAMTVEELMRNETVKGTSEARTEVSKRFSAALASLAFALFAVPMAITAHRKETSVGFMTRGKRSW